VLVRGSFVVVIVALVVAFAGTAFAQHLRPRDVDRLPSSTPQLVAHYGPDPLEYGELRLPSGAGPFPVAVVIHGGCWTSGFATLRNTAPLASALAERGIATWNVEYRQSGDSGGGWPGTFLDWGAATDYVRVLARTQPLDVTHVVVMGHSAGAHAALWLASRAKLPAASEIRGSDPLPVAGAVAIDGPADFASFAAPGIDAFVCGKPVIAPFMGGSLAELPGRYRAADPATRVPLGVPQALIASIVLPHADAAAYAKKARAAGDRVDVLDGENGGHFDIIAPGTNAWKTVGPFIVRFVRSVTGAS